MILFHRSPKIIRRFNQNMKKTKCWLKIKLPGRKIYQNHDSFQEGDSATLPGGIWTQVWRGAESTSWWIVCSSNSLGMHRLLPMKSFHLDILWLQHKLLGVPVALLELVKLPKRWLNQWKREKEGGSELDYCVSIRDALAFGFWFKKQICSAGIRVLGSQPTVQSLVFWTNAFPNFILWHLSHIARWFSISSESREVANNRSDLQPLSFDSWGHKESDIIWHETGFRSFLTYFCSLNWYFLSLFIPCFGTRWDVNKSWKMILF